MIDMSYSLHPGMFCYPSDPDLQLDITTATLHDGKVGSGYALAQLRNHHGTHLDAPAHKIVDGLSIGDYAPARTLTAMVLDVSHIRMREDHAVHSDDLPHQQLDTEAIVVYTGFSDEIARNKGLVGADKLAFERSFSYLTPGAACYLKQLAPNALVFGIDSFSVDPSGSNSEAHITLMKADSILLETLVNCSRVVQKYRGQPFALSYEIPTVIRELFIGTDASPCEAYAGDLK